MYKKIVSLMLCVFVCVEREREKESEREGGAGGGRERARERDRETGREEGTEGGTEREREREREASYLLQPSFSRRTLGSFPSVTGGQTNRFLSHSKFKSPSSHCSLPDLQPDPHHACFYVSV